MGGVHGLFFPIFNLSERQCFVQLVECEPKAGEIIQYNWLHGKVHRRAGSSSVYSFVLHAVALGNEILK
jgi:hypothetical protein